MEQLIYAFSSEVTNPETMLLVESIREFGGSLSNCPIWLFTMKNREEIPEDILVKLGKLSVEIFTLELEPEIAKFPFVGHVYAAKKAEEMAINKSKFLVYLGTNSIFVQEPKLFLLEEGRNLGYRPVHHILIGSKYDQPLDKFWRLIYEKTEVTEDMLFPMQTHVDGNIIRPYINSGYLVVRPERGFFREWWRYYQSNYNDAEFEEFYNKDDLYLTFIHQAILSGVFLSFLKREEIRELPFEYNYPINLYLEASENFKPKRLNQLVTIRYYLEKIKSLDDFKQIPFEEPLRSWLSKRIH